MTLERRYFVSGADAGFDLDLGGGRLSAEGAIVDAPQAPILLG